MKEKINDNEEYRKKKVDLKAKVIIDRISLPVRQYEPPAVVHLVPPIDNI